MLSNSKLQFLKELKSNNFYPFTKDIEDDVYEFILELKTKQIVHIENYQVSIVNQQAIDQMINSKSSDYSESMNHQQNQTPYPAKTSFTKKIISLIMLLAAIAGIVSLILDVIKRNE
ncbi:hypothetical protein AV926_04815 [Myroides marinus]|uniref:Uncharacterized protein n=1 Tax=Myroides marinus TaxID=703342 RepID=A0A164A2G2_9FLAO|nr:hypothetical protein [Myroides marinus]KZE82873.1 hypothetical protein AV926_04815 [Myroides marinus]